MPRKKQPSKTQSQAITQQYTMEFLKIKRLPNLKSKAEQLTAILDQMLVIDDSQLTSSDQEKLQQLAYEIEDELIATQNQIKSSFKHLVISLVLLFIFILTGIGAFFGYRYYHKQWPFGEDSSTTITDDNPETLDTPGTLTPPPTSNPPTVVPKPLIDDNIYTQFLQELQSLRTLPDNQYKIDRLNALIIKINNKLSDNNTSDTTRSQLSILLDRVTTYKQATQGIIDREQKKANLEKTYKEQGYSVQKLFNVGATIQDLIDNGYTQDEILTVFTEEQYLTRDKTTFLGLSKVQKEQALTTLEQEIEALQKTRDDLINSLFELDWSVTAGEELKTSLDKNYKAFQQFADKTFQNIITEVSTRKDSKQAILKNLKKIIKTEGEIQSKAVKEKEILTQIINELDQFKAPLTGIKNAIKQKEAIENKIDPQKDLDSYGFTGKFIKFFYGNPCTILELEKNKIESEKFIDNIVFEELASKGSISKTDTSKAKPSEKSFDMEDASEETTTKETISQELTTIITTINTLKNLLVDQDGKPKKDISYDTIVSVERDIDTLITKYATKINQINIATEKYFNFANEEMNNVILNTSGLSQTVINQLESIQEAKIKFYTQTKKGLSKIDTIIRKVTTEGQIANNNSKLITKLGEAKKFIKALYSNPEMIADNQKQIQDARKVIIDHVSNRIDKIKQTKQSS